MKPVIRKATIRDIDQIFKLYFEFHKFHAKNISHYLASMGRPDDRTNSELVKTLTEIIEGENSSIFTAEVSGHLVGIVEIYLRQDDPSNHYITHHHYGHLQNLVVSEQHRGQGIGKLLVETAHQWAKCKGADEIRLDVWEFGAGPLGFYERLGYHTIKRSLAKEL
jgi:ribosomal protein S18 acetylase RimI-like enzyme